MCKITIGHGEFFNCPPDCPRRSGTCHITCKDYRIAKCFADALREEEEKTRDVKYGLYNQKATAINRIKRNRKEHKRSDQKG